jgi:hypothetical protein
VQRVRRLTRVQFIGEGGEAAQANVQDDAEGPDVHGARVAAVFGVFEDLGRDVAGGAAEGCGEGVFADDFGEAEVSDLDVEVFVAEEDVLWLDVTVDNVPLVLYVVRNGRANRGRV